MRAIILLALGMSLHVHAQQITFSKIDSPKAFQQYWGLTPNQMKQYESYMQIAGKYRHSNSNPLVVLSIIADDDEDKGYFAAKAAAYESQMSQREILSAWLISSEMEKQGLAQAMNAFADQLTGINSKDYVPTSVKDSWQAGDAFYLVIDKVCADLACLSQFDALMNATPDTVMKTIVVKFSTSHEREQQQRAKRLAAIKDHYPAVQVQKYDRIEHGFLDQVTNQAVRVRDGSIIKKL